MSKNEKHYCISFMKDAPSGPDNTVLAKSRAAILKSTKWSLNFDIKIRFLEGSDHLKERVQHFAEMWLGDGMANLFFTWLDDGEADIRIAFQQGNGSWSYLGTQCRLESDQNAPTMNYGWLTDSSSDDEIKRVVLHEFGHALGLIHEHQNPEGGIEWNEQAVIDDLSGPPNNWDEATIRRNVLDHYDPQALQGTEFDVDSIMMYPIPNSWTIGDVSSDLNSSISELDRTLIAEAYPPMKSSN